VKKIGGGATFEMETKEYLGYEYMSPSIAEVSAKSKTR